MWLGGAQSGPEFRQPLRVQEVDTGKTDVPGRPEVLLLATERMDLDAEWLALGYKRRQSGEHGMRLSKSEIGFRHVEGRDYTARMRHVKSLIVVRYS